MRRRSGEAGEGRSFELLMREELSRLLSINFSNYVAEDVPPEETRRPTFHVSRPAPPSFSRLGRAVQN